MIFDIPINVTVEALTEDLAEQQLWDFLKYSKNHIGSTYGFVTWEMMQFIPTEEE